MSDDIEVLANGQVVRCLPPCDDFPAGRKVLLSGGGSLRDKVAGAAPVAEDAYAELRSRRVGRLRRAQASLCDVPHEKRVI